GIAPDVIAGKPSKRISRRQLAAEQVALAVIVIERRVADRVLRHHLVARIGKEGAGRALESTCRAAKSTGRAGDVMPLGHVANIYPGAIVSAGIAYVVGSSTVIHADFVHGMAGCVIGLLRGQPAALRVIRMRFYHRACTVGDGEYQIVAVVGKVELRTIR